MILPVSWVTAAPAGVGAVPSRVRTMSRPVITADTKRGAPPQRVRIPETLPRDELIVSPGTSDPNELQQLDVGDAGGVAAGDGGAEHDLGLADQ